VTVTTIVTIQIPAIADIHDTFDIDYDVERGEGPPLYGSDSQPTYTESHEDWSQSDGPGEDESFNVDGVMISHVFSSQGRTIENIFLFHDDSPILMTPSGESTFPNSDYTNVVAFDKR